MGDEEEDVKIDFVRWREALDVDPRMPTYEHADDVRIDETALYDVESYEMEAEPPLPVEAPLPTERTTERILGELAVSLAEMEQIRNRTQALVLEAKESGATWAQIGEVAGIRAQNAYQRWSEKGRLKHREYERKRRGRATSD